MKRPNRNLMISLAVVLVFAACALVYFLANKDPVQINVLPLMVEQKSLAGLNAKERGKIMKPTDLAVTTWNYGCKPDITFDITQQDLIDDYLVTIKVKGIKLTLDAPITIWVPEGAPADMIKHENAHVKICERVYKDAKPIAQAAAEPVINQSFQASGKTLDLALKAAVAKASREVADQYGTEIIERTNRVSEIYDLLEDRKPDASQEQLIKESFSQFNTHIQ